VEILHDLRRALRALRRQPGIAATAVLVLALGRPCRQVLTESLLLAALGATGGLLLAGFGTRLLLAVALRQG